jgi:hypothetical protein
MNPFERFIIIYCYVNFDFLPHSFKSVTTGIVVFTLPLVKLSLRVLATSSFSSSDELLRGLLQPAALGESNPICSVTVGTAGQFDSTNGGSAEFRDFQH